MNRLALAMCICSWADSARPCSPLQFSAVSPSVGIVPANLPGLDVFGYCETDAMMPTLVRVGDNESVPLVPDVGGRYEFGTPLVEGETYKIERCHESFTFAVGAPAVWSGYAGKLAVTVVPRHLGGINGGPACTQSADIVSARFLFQPHQQFDPWLDHVDFTLTLNGPDIVTDFNWTAPVRDIVAADQGLPPVDWRYRTAFEVYASCSDTVGVAGLPSGTYTATLHARMPGSMDSAATDSVTFELDCGQGDQPDGSESGPELAEDVERDPEADTVEVDGGAIEFREQNAEEGCSQSTVHVVALLLFVSFRILRGRRRAGHELA